MADDVTASISLNLDNLAHALVHTLDGNGLSTFIFNLVALRDDDAWTAELVAELGEPYVPPPPWQGDTFGDGVPSSALRGEA
jgi:hypothetical protein